MSKYAIRLLILLPVLIYACGTLQVERKRHSKGYYVHWNTKHSSQQADERSAQVKPEEKSFEKTEVSASMGKNMEKSEILTLPPTSVVDSLQKEASILNVSEKKASQSHIGSASTAKKDEHFLKMKSEKSESHSAWSMALLLLFPFLFLNKDLGRSMSIWASENKVKAQFLFAASSILLFAISLGLGFLLRIPLNPITAGLSIAGLIIGLVRYYGGGTGVTSRQQRLVGSSFFRIGAIVSAFGVGGVFAQSGFGMIGNWSLRAGLLEQVEESSEMYYSAGESIIMVVLGVGLLLFLLYITAVLSCSLSCNGQDTLAVFVALGGVFLAFFLAFLLFFNAFRKVDEEMNRIIRKAFIAGGVAMVAFGVYLLVMTLMY
jgi:hypothetical protein